jgi:hypothetical protein
MRWRDSARVRDELQSRPDPAAERLAHVSRAACHLHSISVF